MRGLDSEGIDSKTVTRATAVFIFVLALVPRVGWWHVRGTFIVSATTTAMSNCERLVEQPSILLSDYVFLTQSGWNLQMCTLQSITGGRFYLIALLQIVLGAIACVLVFDAGRRLYDYRAGFVAGVSLAALFQTFEWEVYVGPDAWLAFGIVLSIWALVFHRQHGTKRTRLLAFCCLLWTALIRPHGMLLFASWTAIDALPERYDEYRPSVVPRKIAVGGAIIGVVAVVFMALQLNTLGTIGPTRLVEDYANGKIIHKDPVFTYHYDAARPGGFVQFFIANAPHVVAITVIRVVVFYFPFVMRYSTTHILINVVTLVPLLVGTALGIWYQFRDRSPDAVLLFVPVLVLTGIVAITWIDFAFRYRAPLGGVFALYTGYVVVTNSYTDRWSSRLLDVGVTIAQTARRRL